MLSATYSYLTTKPVPNMIAQALKLYGTKEVPGAGNSPVILSWAKELGGWIGGWYKEDAVPWCGLFIGVVAKRAGFEFTQEALGARNWLKWGQPVDVPMLGDVMVFGREGGGHVALYVGEDGGAYHVLGGNQNDQVNITRIAKDRLLGVRRPLWKVKQPDSVRKIKLQTAGGPLSRNEA